MNGKKIFLMVMLILLLIGAVGAGLYWNQENYVLVDMKMYPRNARQLDLRGEDVSVRHYEKIQRSLPDCEILWDVPFQGNTLPNDTKVITVTSLSEQDIKAMDYFAELETVEAKDCTEYENLLKLQQRRPEVRVNYQVRLGAESVSGRAEQIELASFTEDDIAKLPYLPALRKVLCSGGTGPDVSALKEYCQKNDLEFMISLGGNEIPLDTEEVKAGAITETELGLLECLPKMKTLHIRNPEAAAESLLSLQKARPDVTITWEQEIYGKTCSSDEKELDLSDADITGLEELEQKMAYFPDAETVFLGECALDNEDLANHRDRVREDYKLVWTVSCGSKLKTRTDATTFMPVREKVYYFNDEEAYNLRYCEDMVCIDIGHMSIHNIDFVKYMPNLEFLILAHTQVQYIEPISTCKKLKFLELDWSPLKDLTPLKECTALEDLNLGNTFADFAPVAEMTWLKNLWMIDCSTRARYEMTEALPNTKVMVTGAATVANGWRDLDNYYEMRDLLGMHYMSW